MQRKHSYCVTSNQGRGGTGVYLSNLVPQANPPAKCGPTEITNGTPSDQLVFPENKGQLEQAKDKLEEAQNDLSA